MEQPDIGGADVRVQRPEASDTGAAVGGAAGTRRAPGRGGLWSKVPEVTVLFWVVKILTTGMGESTSDFLAKALGPVVAGALGVGGIVVLLWLQFRAPRYRAWTYWSTIVMVSIFGTMAADVVHVVLGVPYIVSTATFALVLAGVLTAWYVSEGTLSIHSVRTRRRELFYWATVLATFALGTAVGDLSASTLHLGYLPAGLLFTGLILMPPVARRLGLNPVASFWWAYVLTRPLGASFADWGATGHARGGLGLGTGLISFALAVPIAALIAYLAVSRKDTPVEGPAAPAPHGAHRAGR